MGLAFLLGLTWLVACARPSPTSIPELPKPPTDPWSWLPPESSFVGSVALAELRQTQLWPLWAEVEKEQRIDAWVPLEKVRRITFGGTGQSRANLSYVAALEGDFSLLELSELGKRDGVAPERHGLLVFYRRPEALWAQVTEKLIVVCTFDRLEQVSERAGTGPGTPVKDAALYKSLAERINLASSHVAMLAEDPDGKGKALLDRRAQQYGLGSFTQDAQRLGFSVEIGTDYRLVALAETADEARAQALQGATRDKLDAVASSMIVRMLGVGGLIDRLRVSGDGNYVFVRGTVPVVDFNATLERLHRLLSLSRRPGETVSGEPNAPSSPLDDEAE